MDFLSIIAFIGIAIISSAINGSKKKGQNPSSRQRPYSGMNRPTMQDTMNRPTASPANNTQRPQHRSKPFSASSLEDIFREMQSDIRGVFGELKNSNAPKPPTKAAPIVEQKEAEQQEEEDSWDNYTFRDDNEYGDNERLTSVADDRHRARGQSGIEDSLEVYEKRQISLNLSKNALVQAIIMSEILDKPKALRR